MDWPYSVSVIPSDNTSHSKVTRRARRSFGPLQSMNVMVASGIVSGSVNDRSSNDIFRFGKFVGYLYLKSRGDQRFDWPEKK